MIEKTGIMTLEEKQCWEYHLTLPEDSISQILYFDVTLDADLDEIILRINSLYEKNPSLRMSFYEENGILYQSINFFDKKRKYFLYFDLRSRENQNEFIKEYTAESEMNMDIRKIHEYSKFVVFHLEERKFRCILFMHHIICDEWSVGLLRDQFLNNCSYCIDFDIIDYANEQREYVLNVKKDLRIYYESLFVKLNTINPCFIPLLNRKEINLKEFENEICKSKTTLYRISFNVDDEITYPLMAVVYLSYCLASNILSDKKTILITAPIRNNVGNNKKLVGYLNSGIYTLVEKEKLSGDVNSKIKNLYLNIINSMRYSVADHKFINLDGRFLRKQTSLYINIMSKEYDVDVNDTLFKGSFTKENSYPYYPLSIYFIEKHDKIFIEYSFCDLFYSNKDIINLHNLFKTFFTSIKSNVLYNCINMKNILFILLLISIQANAQYFIKGCVTDSVGTPIEAAVVVLMNPQDGMTLQQGITTKGEYNLNAKGKAQLLVSCLGYKQYVSSPFVISSDTVLHTIKLKSEDFLLNDVVIIGEKQSPSVKIEKGKMIFTPKNSSIIAGSTALEVLKKTPGVFVDGENNISIGGKNSVLVILNGKQTYMQKDELITLLKATPSSSVSSVEVMHNPSAQYDAEGSGGIININMNRKKSEGFFFSLNNGVSYWENLRENTELSFSYTKNRFSLSGNYNHAFGYYNMDYGMHRIQEGKDYYSPTQDTDKRKTISGNLNMEYALNDKHLIGARIDANTLFGPGQTNTVTEIRDVNTKKLEQILYASNDYYTQKGNRYGGNLYYMATPKEGVSYNLDFNYAWFDGGSGNWQPNKYVSPDGYVIQNNLYKSVNSRDINIYAVSYDQKHPLWNGELKSGLKFSSVNADNGYQFYDADNGQETIDKSQSNDFRYKEQILAGYILYSHSLGDKISMEAGLRGEYTFSDGLLHTIDGDGDENNKRNYFNLFPTFNLNYQINDSHALILSYASRIDRPAYQDLNPFEYLLDELSYWKGNPFLTPQKTHKVALTYSHNRTAITASYSYMKDYKAQITDTLLINKVIMTPRNIGKQQRVSLTLYQGVNIARWWEMNLNLIGYYVKNDIAFDQYRKFNLDGFAGIFSIQNTVRMPWQIQMELNSSYVTKRLGTSNEYIDPSGYVDIGFSKSFANKRWTVNLSMSDIFWTSRWDNYSSFTGFQLWNWGKGETRQIKLNVTYKFGKQKNNSHINNFNEIDRL